MKRKEFLAKTAAASTTVIALSSVTDALAKSFPQPEPARKFGEEIGELAPISTELRKNMDQLLAWMNEKGWSDHIQRISGINIKRSSQEMQDELVAELDVNRFRKEKGFDDFAGNRLIHPGQPTQSMLYHAMASPRVKLQKQGTVTKEDYPSIDQLDILENFIYALKKYDDTTLKSNKTVIAVFAYEYRTAFKTTHGKHADLAFSRTGISRIGDKEMQYDKELRCFVNLPSKKEDEKHIAVTAARYGLFLAELKKKDDISLMSEESRDEDREFLLPFRKLFNNDLLLDNTSIVFSEYHCTEKLNRLSRYKEKEMEVVIPPGFDIEKPPFKRISSTEANTKFTDHNSNLVTITQTSSSAILAAYPTALIRPAIQNNQPLRFKVPVNSGDGFKSNRRYTSLKLQYKNGQNARDYVLTEFFFKRSRSTRFSAPRNAPLFVNIRNEVKENNGEPIRYLGPALDHFEEELQKSYWAAMYEDGICDGCVHARLATTISKNNILHDKLFKEFLPAFSLVTTPDFFPDADSFDLEAFDKGRNSIFLQGGIENLSTARKRPNDAITIPGQSTKAFPDVRVKDPKNNQTLVYDTLTAVLSCKPVSGVTGIDEQFFEVPQNKDYTGTSFLPDTASFIFAPGWDVTYCGNSSKKVSEQEIFLATYGLGSPFAEDMKLCAAANGMWPVASPDASRTFKGTIDPLPTGLHGKLRNPVSVPLMDDEIGLHADSPAVKQHALSTETLGWDGEQGPFLEKRDDKITVNFTDLGRADYVQNVLDNHTDMSKLRRLRTPTLIARMDALRVSVKQIEKRDNIAYSRLWLVSAEEITDWNKGALAWGIPNDLFGNNNNWAKTFQSALNNSPAPGHLYVFAKTTGKTEFVDSHGKRKWQECDTIYVCQVTPNSINWTKIDKKTGNSLKWHSATK